MTSPADPSDLVAGIGGGTRSASVALAVEQRLLGVCYQERVTRVRGVGVTEHGLPNEALDLLLRKLGRTRQDIGRYVIAGGGDVASAPATDAVDHHFALACTAFLTSPHDSAVIVVCDRDAPGVTVWTGDGSAVAPADLHWRGTAFTQVLSTFAELLGFRGVASNQRFEALARLAPQARDSAIDALLRLDDDGLVIAPGLAATVGRLLPTGGYDEVPRRAAVAASLQARLGDLLLEWLERVQRRVGATRLCLGGSLFHNSAINTRVKAAALFADVFVPVDPGTAGQAVGAALSGLAARVAPASPFLGPDYAPQEVKEVLDNCKLQYSWESENGILATVVRALADGHLVGWFDGPMEWGQRALGARCILANPAAPYVLENLNRFLKNREPWRGYALSGLAPAVHEHFDGPASAPFMECDYRPRTPGTFAHALPSSAAAVRVHTVGDDARPRFAGLLEAFGQATGLPFLINTSFNGFHEPIVCSPRDAVRVFFGTGLDVLVMNQFVVRK